MIQCMCTFFLQGKPAQQTSDSTVGFSIGAGPSTLRHQTIRYNMYIPEATLDMTVPFPRTSGARFCGSGQNTLPLQR